MTLWGACVSGTRIVTRAPSETTAALTLAADGASAPNLSVDGPERVGIAAFGVSGVALEAAVVADAAVVGPYMGGGSLLASDAVVRQTSAWLSDGGFGRGISVQAGAQLVLRRVALDDNRDDGIFAEGVGTSVEASELAVRHTREQTSDGASGYGVRVQSGARLVLAGDAVEHSRDFGIFADGAGTIVEASDVVVRGTRDRAVDGAIGTRPDVGAGAHLTLARSLVADNRAPGAFISLTRALVDDSREGRNLAGATDVSLDPSSLVVRDTSPLPSDGTGGAGVLAANGAHVVIGGARTERSRWVGIVCTKGASIDARDVVVSGVEASRCPVGVCTGDTGGFGIVAIFGGAVAATRFVVEGATVCGVMVGRNSATPTGFDLEASVISRSTIDPCVQQDGFDTSRLQQGVEYRELGVPLRATRYELPSDGPAALPTERAPRWGIT